jgi:hypothetical protein
MNEGSATAATMPATATGASTGWISSLPPLIARSDASSEPLTRTCAPSARTVMVLATAP